MVRSEKEQGRTDGASNLRNRMAFILLGASTRARAQEVTANRRERKQALWRAQDDERASKELPSFVDTSVVKDSVKDTPVDKCPLS